MIDNLYEILTNWEHVKSFFLIADPRRLPEERDENWLKIIGRLIISAFWYPTYRLVHPNHPFYAPGAIKFLEQWIQDREQEITMFEYGSGISTLWWAERVSSYTGVEHSKEWFDIVSKELDKRSDLTSVNLLYQGPVSNEINWENEWEHYDMVGRAPQKPEFSSYISVIDQFPDEHFDIISVDGRERVGSAAHAISKVKSDGILLFDDSSRPRYKDGLDLFENWVPHVFNFGLQQTTIFAKN